MKRAQEAHRQFTDPSFSYSDRAGASSVDMVKDAQADDKSVIKHEDSKQAVSASATDGVACSNSNKLQSASRLGSNVKEEAASD